MFDVHNLIDIIWYSAVTHQIDLRSLDIQSNQAIFFNYEKDNGFCWIVRHQQFAKPKNSVTFWVPNQNEEIKDMKKKQIHICTGCSLNIVFFLKCCDFLNSASSAAAALVFDLPLCTLTDTEGNPRWARVRNVSWNLRKKTHNI